MNERNVNQNHRAYQLPSQKVRSFLAARAALRNRGDDDSVEAYANAQEEVLKEVGCAFASRARAVCLIELSMRDMDCQITAQFMKTVGIDLLRSFGVHVNDDPVADEGSGLLDDDFIL